MSDLHIRPWDELGYLDDADIYIVCGDVDSGTYGCSFIDWRFTNKEVVYIPGNHEFYGEEYFSLGNSLKNYKWENIKAGGCFNNQVYYNKKRKIRFICSLLWSDCSSLPLLFNNKDPFDILKLEKSINDFRQIKYGEEIFSVKIMTQLHIEAKEFLLKEIMTPYEGKTVVVTHFPPSLRSLEEKHSRDPISAYFMNELPEEYFEGVNYWICGHTHWRHEYKIGNCTVINNARGYKKEIPEPFQLKIINV